MERNSYNGDFERFLKENTEQYRMYPSEKVWQGVQKSITKRNRRYRITAFVLLLSAVSFIAIMLNSTKNSGVKNQAELIPSTESSSDKDIQSANSRLSIPAETAVPKTGGPEPVAVGTPVRQSRFHEYRSSSRSAERNNTIASINPGFSPAENQSASILVKNIPEDNFQEETSFGTGFPAVLSEKANLLTSRHSAFLASMNEKSGKIIADVITGTVPGINKRKAKASWQFHFTPTVSYRKLTDNKQYPSPIITSSGYSYTSLLSVNDVVYHKPDLGFEIGFDARYPLSGRLKLKMGLQTNITRYGIRAYSYRSEVATIALNNGNGYANSLNAISNYRNFSGYNSNWLENLYLQLSAPIGFDFIAAKTKDMQIGFSSSLQPTYLLGKKAYLISADYKNYVKVPGLIRTWNMNADIETFVAFGKGKVQWQIGPQVRYQLLSSFVKKYPVKENLYDFGFKVGMSLNK